jgi:adenosylcobinamide-GDP ribazoletransferase
VRGFVTAARYLTVLPLPARPARDGTTLGRSAAWFPVVGALLGLGLGAGDRGLGWLLPSTVAAALTVTGWKLLTGGLHLDGLADSLDGIMGGDPDERLRIMRDSRIGVFGAAGLVLALLLDVTALAELPAGVRWRALVAAPAIGRAAPPLLARAFRPARADGEGARFASGTPAAAAVTAGLLALGVAFLALGPAGIAGLGLAAAAVGGVEGFLTGRLGGFTGDSLGAAVELAELMMLITVAAWVHLGLPT